MGVDYSFVLAGQCTSLAAAVTAIDRNLGVAGFRPLSEPVPAALDKTRGVFDELDWELPHRPIHELHKELEKLSACSLEYTNDVLQFYMLVGIVAPGEVNSWIDVSYGRLQRLAENNQQGYYFTALDAIAKGMNAVGGYGAQELAFHPTSPDDTLDAIFTNPQNQPWSADLGIVSQTNIDRAELLRRATSAGDFRITMLSKEYWLMVHKDFADIFGRVRSNGNGDTKGS